MSQKNALIPRPVKVLDVYHESPDTITITLDMQVDHEPGQFIQVSLFGIGEAPISISSYSNKFLKISVRAIGNVTNELAKVQKGDILHVRGPYGNGYPLKEYFGKSIVLIGGGCGVAPLKGAIDYIEAHREKFHDIYLFLGFRGPADILFKRELVEWRKKYHIETTVEEVPQGTCYTGQSGYITKALSAFSICGPDRFVVFMCGPPPMMNASVKILREKKVPFSRMFVSTERLMYCAIGQCCHCMVRDKFICTDGPVFCYEDIRRIKSD
ncbi:FAD/NAD(P)-binding protein [Candidatus Peregrinibacteria bacterium]|nr:FAD/NAD(P)-binding protein [Candidatus Peregrinibacteria bacterium]